MYYENLRPRRAQTLRERLGHERGDIRFKVRFIPDLHAGVVRERHDLRRRLACGFGRCLRRRFRSWFRGGLGGWLLRCLRCRFRGGFGRRLRGGFGRRLRRWFRCWFRRRFRRRLRCDLRCRRFAGKVVREQQPPGRVRVAELQREQRRAETPAFICLGGAFDRPGQRPGMERQLRRHDSRAQQPSLPVHFPASLAHRYYLSYGAAAGNMTAAC